MDLDELYRLLRGSHVQAVSIVNTLRDPLVVLDDDFRVLTANPAFYKTFSTSRDETIGTALADLGNGQWNIPELRLLLDQVIPRSTSVIDYEVRAEFPHIGPRTMLVSAQRLSHPDSGQRILLFTIVDATERRQADDDKDILIGELGHRIKNLLAVTRAIARRTGVEGRSAEEYRDDFLGRFDALARSLAVSTQEAEADLGQLVRAVMEPWLEETSAITLDGQGAIALLPRQAMSLGMILHELATNALKHGALSVPGGLLDISWNLAEDRDGQRQVHLCWRESNGPEASPPEAVGFGTCLIRFATEVDLKGQAELSYRQDGFVADLTFPQ
ncbi:HWE histidine kinase domain-containing protein [Paracoccus sp. WLY502]|uniref:HWE histidine kinase domain-containing protein n=1 Tax=Paracoccus yibinensis TaxID=3068891 RepID=UPI0027964BD8|nr:HWE histidine kinase domain-containing protein [Paracoccus sp. WLY502]MDQ1902261.1 HWE histidine kinase domain-containing protein [Paracoccus sp. WLY502]